MRIQIQGAKPMQIYADLDLDSSQTLPSQKGGFWHEKYTLKYVGIMS
jgi:hypothetical protein